MRQEAYIQVWHQWDLQDLQAWLEENLPSEDWEVDKDENRIVLYRLDCLDLVEQKVKEAGGYMVHV